MNDKELLEKAAKAAGIDLQLDDDGLLLWVDVGFLLPYSHKVWNPLTDDGDAFRLAADVGLMIDFWHERVISGTRYAQGHRDWLYADDCDGSMPLVITRAAAAMVKE